MDSYYRYIQIPMHKKDHDKTTFMKEHTNYMYKVMPFGLKNVGEMYKNMMNKVFEQETGDMLKMYMDDLIFKYERDKLHESYTVGIFNHVHQYNMMWNPEKWTFIVKAGKLLGFYLTEIRIEANLYKCDVIIKMETPSTNKSIVKANGTLTVHNRFISRSSLHALQFYKFLRK